MTPTESMHAIRAHSAEPTDLRYEQVPRPVPDTGEVLVAVRATAVTAGELGWSDEWPLIPAHDLSGVVAELGPGVTGLAAGDEVYGLIGFDRPGAAAEYVAVPVDQLAAKPGSIDHVAAASVPLGALTAWQALVEHANVVAGQSVLVHGGAGGVGSYAVQLAAHLGAKVTATASRADAEFVTGLGAHAAIDYRSSFEDQVSGVDVVIDTVGGQTLARSWQVLRPGGILVGVADEPAAEDAERHGVRSAYFVVAPDPEQLTKLARLVDSGALRPMPGPVFPLAETATAVTTQRDQHIRGKVVIEVRADDAAAVG
ncbi:MAG TPA: NADP-dependent oxidoreductase [Actinomycetes bacterium]|nr:NADP-dependent oxidoreductase [Actinomycetes bacterium]